MEGEARVPRGRGQGLGAKLILKEQPLVLPPAGQDGGPKTKKPGAMGRFGSKSTAEPKSSRGHGSRTERAKSGQSSQRVPPISFETFRRNKEREQQSAPVYDIRSARSGVLQSVCHGEAPALSDEFFGIEDFPLSSGFFSGEVSELRPSTAGGIPSRPGTRQSARHREAQLKLQEAKEDLELEEENDETIISVAQKEQLKQEYWQEYNEAGSAKKTLSEFEEWQRVLHSRAEVSTTASEVDQDGGVSRISVDDSEWRISHLGFTRRSEYEEYMSDYYRRCRQRHYIPLGPRGTREDDVRPTVDPVKPGMLHFGGWSLGSARLEMLCQAPGAVEHCKRCDLSSNRIEDRSVPILCDKLLPRAESLNLSNNSIGQMGIRYFEQSLRKITMSPLLELNLQGNRLGSPFGSRVAADAYERDLCNFVDALSTRTPELRALNLAQNGLGRVNHELGKAIGTMVMELQHLRVLDLHYNSCHGLGAYKLLEGIGENNLSGGGTLSRVDLSWNRLGLATAKSHSPSKVLAEVLASNDKLFHLDISYNAIGTEDCAIIANGLRYNTSLFGFHVSGNEAFLDELGFIMPLSDPYRLQNAGIEIKEQQESVPVPAAVPAEVKSAWTAEEAASQLLGREIQHPSFPVKEGGGKTICWEAAGADSGKKRGKPGKQLSRGPRRKFPPEKQKSSVFEAPKPAVPWEEWQESEYSMPLAQSFQRSNLEEVTSRAERCWICDRSQPAKIVWTPAISSNLNEDEVIFVHAYVSSDDFHRPTLLKRVAAENQAARFVGFRMVPKVQENFLIIFRVNGHIEVANDLPIRFLPCPAKVPLLTDEDLVLVKKNEGAEILANLPLPEKSTTETRWGNELILDRPVPLLVTEAQVQGGELEVYPRRVDKVQQEVQEVDAWSKAFSVFASWADPTEALFDKMLAMDLKFCRHAKFAPDTDTLQLKRSMLQIYPKLVTMYRKMSCWSDKHQTFGVSLHNVQAFLQRGRLFDRHMQSDHLPSMAFASHVVERRFQEEIKVFSEHYLIRYQFIETFLRVAEAKLLKPKKVESLGQAFNQLCSALEAEMTPLFEREKDFRAHLFTEEVDLVFKNNLNLLNAAYNIYAGITEVPDAAIYAVSQRSGKRKITLPDLFELLDDCDAYDQSFMRTHTSRAFNLASEWNVDEVSSFSHMRLNFVEFLAALGAVVYLKETYVPDEFADLLEEFILDQLKPVVLEYRARTGKGEEIEGLLTHKTLRKVCAEIFRSADEDSDETLSVLEFGNALRDPKTKELFKGKEFHLSQIMEVFGALDEDGSGELNFAEVLHGISALLKMEQTEPRIRAFLKKELSNEDGKGQYTADTLATFLHKRTTQRKLMRVGIVMDNVTQLVIQSLEIAPGTRSCERLTEDLKIMFSNDANASQREEALQDFKGGIAAMRQESALFSSNHFIEELLRLRRPKSIPRWKILIKQIFEKADLDQCGTLTKEEFTNALQSHGTQARLESMNIDPEVVEEMFDIIDVDGSDDVTEAEMIYGIELMLKLREESEHFDLDDLRERMPQRHQQHQEHQEQQHLRESTEEEHPTLQLTRKATTVASEASNGSPR